MAVAIFLHAELLDLAADGVAADAQQLGCLDPPPAGGSQRAADQGALEVVRELLEHRAGADCDQAVGFLAEAVDPARRGLARRLIAHLGRKIGHFHDLGGITVSQ